MLTRTLPTQVADHLRERILGGTLAPGERILETELAAEFQVSRHTLRSALQTLTSEGLLVQNQFRSTHVAEPTAEDVYEIYTLRNALEAMACRLAAQRAPTAATSGIDAAVARMRAGARAGDRDAVKAADFDFHVAVVELAGHARLREHYRSLHAQTRLFLNLTAAADYPLHDIAELHAQLAAAITAGDAARAERLGGEHNTSDGEAICGFLRSRSAEGGGWEDPSYGRR